MAVKPMEALLRTVKFLRSSCLYPSCLMRSSPESAAVYIPISMHGLSPATWLASTDINMEWGVICLTDKCMRAKVGQHSLQTLLYAHG